MSPRRFGARAHQRQVTRQLALAPGQETVAPSLAGVDECLERVLGNFFLRVALGAAGAAEGDS